MRKPNVLATAFALAISAPVLAIAFGLSCALFIKSCDVSMSTLKVTPQHQRK